MVGTFEDQLRAWRDDNPLRQWRTRGNVGVETTAMALRVSRISVQQWEKGVMTPSAQNLYAIGELIADPRIFATWLTWLAKQPQF